MLSKSIRSLAGLALLFMGARAYALKPVLADQALLQEAGIKALATEHRTGVSFAQISPDQELRLSQLAHEHGRCGGYEALPYSNSLEGGSPVMTGIFDQLVKQDEKNRRFHATSNVLSGVPLNPAITSALSQISAENIHQSVIFLSGYPTRLHDGETPNVHVEAVRERLDAVLKASGRSYKIDLIDHQSTPQKSVRVHLEGATRPSEIVVLGAHLDSINREWFGSGLAPGADDNASGSSDLFEALRVLLTQPPTERSIEFFWYAGEEAGLLVSAEIARDYKAQQKDVIGVLQLDMTMFPGNGEFVLGSMNDFTSSWLRSYLEELNSLYIKAKIIDDKCGYGCSDHASWYRQGYPTLMPFEASFNGMNHNLHTAKDLIDDHSNFQHSAMFAKIALSIALDLGNSTARQP